MNLKKFIVSYEISFQVLSLKVLFFLPEISQDIYLCQYIFANLSICSSAASPLICSITFPLIVTISYGLFWSDIANATLGSREIFFCLILPIAVLIRILPFSISVQVGVT